MARPETLVESEASTVPVLEQGDHLSRAEFERRYDAMPELKKAELIEGIVSMASPVRLRRHGRPHSYISAWITSYEGHTPGVLTGDNVSIRLAGDEMPQPDAVLMIEPERGGQANVSVDDYIEGAPELIVEVAASTTNIDLNTKLRVYQRNNVREYLVWRVLDRAIDWFVLVEGEYQKLEAGTDGITRSKIFPGLWLDTEALLNANLPRVLEVLRQGLADDDHAAFVARLNPNPSAD
jgi:Uma2 family endonuclease